MKIRQYFKNEDTFSIEERVFNLSMFFLIIIAVYNSINAIILSISTYIFTYWILNTVMFFAIFLLGINKKVNFNIRLAAISYIMYLFYPFMWIVLGGINGPAIVYISIVMVLFSICIERKILFFFLFVFLLMMIMLIIFQYNFSYVFFEYEIEKKKYIDLTIGTGIVLFYIPMVISRYVKEISFIRQNVIKYSRDLEGKFKQALEDKNQVEKLYGYLREKNDMLEQMSIKDELSGAYNRRYILSRLKREMHYATQTLRPLCILMIDLDEFKKINDSYGHQVGDSIIREVGRTLLEGVNGKGIVGRYGGDEFLIIIPKININNAYELSQEIAKAINKIRIGSLTVKFSGGLVQYKGEEVKPLIEKADELMYAAKQNGRNIIIK